MELDTPNGNRVQVNTGTELRCNGDLDVNGSTDLLGTTIVGNLSLSSGYGQFDNIRIGDDQGGTAGSGNNRITSTNTNGSIFILPNGSGNVRIGTDEDNDLQCKGDVIAFHSSDKTLKENITPIPNALDKVLSLSGNTFTWIEGHKYEGQDDTGVIAQEVEALGLPGISTTRESGKKAVRYEKLIPVLIEAIKELKSEIEELKK